MSPITPRVVTCDEVVQSQKRGVCENHMDAGDFQALAPGVSWYYNWHFKTDDVADSSLKMTFVPMVWGDNADAISGLESYLQSGTSKPPFILAVNEPNLKGQAFINPEKTADLYQRVKQTADTYNIPIVGPNMALGSAPDQSIKAFDPIQNADVTYTFMIPFMKAFLNFEKVTNPNAAGLHTYGNIGEMQWAIGTMHKECNCPVWVTEFACWGASDAKAERDYMIHAVDFMERTDYVKGYAWFKERMVGDGSKMSLLDPESGKLTELGQCYVNLPVHDKSLFYKIPGKLSAGKYVTLNGADISASPEGSISIDSKSPGSSVTYNLYVDMPGTYNIETDFSGTGKITLTDSGMALGSISADKGIASVIWGRGYHHLQMQFDSNGILLNSINFTKRS